MKNTAEDLVCCDTTMQETQTEIFYLNDGKGDFPVFIDRKYACTICNDAVTVEVNDPEERERIAGHLLAKKALAPLCCLEAMQERQPEVFLMSYPVEVNRVFWCQYCKEYQYFAVTDPAQREVIASTLFSQEVTW